MLIFFLRPSDHSTPIPDGVERPPHRKATIKSFHTAEKEERKWIFHPHKSPHRNHMKSMVFWPPYDLPEVPSRERKATATELPQRLVLQQSEPACQCS